MKLTVGADPEVFVNSLKADGKTISAHDFPCGNKWEPRKTRHGAVQVDGVALEFNVRPASSQKAFVRNIWRVVDDLQRIVDKHDDSCFLVFKPYNLFTRQYLDTLPPEQRVLGCNADWNAYTMFMNPPPDAELPIRTAAGHVHLGWGDFDETRSHLEVCASLTKELDVWLGLPSLLWDPDVHRRELYGKAGAFRPKKYGCEYRVLSNIWVTDKKLAAFVFRQTKECFEAFQRNELLSPEYGKLARTCIDEGRDDWTDKAPKLAEFLEIDRLDGVV